MTTTKKVGQAFVAYNSLEKNRDIVDWFCGIISAIGIEPMLFDFGSSEPLPIKDRELIEKSNCFIAIAFRGDKIGEGCYSCAPWIHNEIGIAFGLNKPILFFVESDIQIENSIIPKITTYKTFEKEKLRENVEDILVPLMGLRERLRSELSSPEAFYPTFYRAVKSQFVFLDNGGVEWYYESEITVLKDYLSQVYHSNSTAYPDTSLKDSEIELYLTEYKGTIRLNRQAEDQHLNTWIVEFDPPIEAGNKCRYGFRYVSKEAFIPLTDPNFLIRSYLSSGTPVKNRAQDGTQVVYPTTKLLYSYVFPKGYKLTDPDCHVFWLNTIQENENEFKRMREEKCFSSECFAERWKLELDINNPQIGLYYVFSWLPIH